MRVLLAGIALFFLSEIFPPWYYEDGMTSARRPAGYHFLLSKPKLRSPAEMKKLFSFPEEDPLRYITIHKDRARLVGQRIIIPFAMVGVLLILDDQQRRAQLMLGTISLCIASGLLIIYAHLFRPFL